ncbi:hypothetical protein PHMEG_00024891 [Phytophthora megakarya]|uniref:ATP-dependent DNA helicase n=1 Tax=Phytophthora megakarya TaxID=4795 RepID=A0A225VCG4_9STRA|nr:hypothetical protein PHMEG_00024891 [Phytophthora megakarya]
MGKNEKTDNKLIVDGNREIIGVKPTQVVELIRDALQISKEYTLNLLQHKAFCKIRKVLLTRWLNTEPGEGGYEGEDYEAKLSQDQLLFFLGGAGRTGKSRVIDAVSRFCCGWKRDECIMKTALTGKAATLIHGRTLASFLLSIERSKDTDFIGVDITVIDEVSMMTKPDWTKLDKLLRQYKRLSGVPFGGIHIILVGDFLQLPPVGLDSIYIDPRNKQYFSTVDIDGFLNQFVFVMIQNEVKGVQLLDWEGGLKLTKDHENDLSAETVFVTRDNATRTAINNECITATAERLPAGHYSFRIVGNFKGALCGLSRRDVE